MTVSDDRVAQYLAVYPYGGVPGLTGLQMIYTQLWISKFFNWYEAWNDWRRTDWPALVPTNHPSSVTGGKIPVRLKYPNREVAGNPNFASTASANDFTTRVWWDVK